MHYAAKIIKRGKNQVKSTLSVEIFVVEDVFYFLLVDSKLLHYIEL